MSTRIGTLQPQARLGHPVRLAGLLAAFVAVTLAFAVISVVRDRSEEAPASEVVSVEANTPSELSGGMVRHGVAGGTLANTPSEVRGGLVQAPSVGGTSANTPSELSGGVVGTRSPWTGASSTGRRGVTPRMSAVVHERTERPLLVNGQICQQCQ